MMVLKLLGILTKKSVFIKPFFSAKLLFRIKNSLKRIISSPLLTVLQLSYVALFFKVIFPFITNNYICTSDLTFPALIYIHTLQHTHIACLCTDCTVDEIA